MLSLSKEESAGLALKPVDAEGVIAGDETATKELCQALMRQGWAVLTPLPSVATAADDALAAAEAFLSGPDEGKAPFQLTGRFGYVPGPGAREGIRLLTGPYASDDKAPLPEAMRAPLQRLCAAYDDAAHAMAAALCGARKVNKKIARKYVAPSKLFVGTPRELGLRGKLPLLAGPIREGDGKTGVDDDGDDGDDGGVAEAGGHDASDDDGSRPEGAFGMLDIVDYAVGSAAEGRGYHVAEHVDPGLFALSAGSTAPGLQLYDPHGDQWLAPPLDAFVLWAGAAAVQCAVHDVLPGLHRVQLEAPEAGAAPYRRRTMWFELCAQSQVPRSVLDAGALTRAAASDEKALEMLRAARASAPAGGAVEVPADAAHSLTRGVRVSAMRSPHAMSASVIWLPDVNVESETVDGLQRRIEDALGVPSMKMQVYVELHHPSAAEDMGKAIEDASSTAEGKVAEAIQNAKAAAKSKGNPLTPERADEVRDHAVGSHVRTMAFRALVRHKPLELGTGMPLASFGVKTGDLILTTTTSMPADRMRAYFEAAQDGAGGAGGSGGGDGSVAAERASVSATARKGSGAGSVSGTSVSAASRTSGDGGAPADMPADGGGGRRGSGKCVIS